MITSRNPLSHAECHWKVFKGEELSTERRTIREVSQFTRNPPSEGNLCATTMNEHHCFLSIASNSKVKSTRLWDLILIFKQLVWQDFHQVVPHSLSTTWQRPWQLLRVLVVLLHRRITTGCTFNYFSSAMPQPQPQKKLRAHIIESDDED